MNDINKQKTGRIYLRLGVLTFGLLILAFVDVIVLEMIYKQISLKHAIPWNEFEIPLPLVGGDGRMLWWHVAFSPLGFALFAIAGISGRDWRLALAGTMLFATGWEDIAYYIVQFKFVPNDLPWLDKSPPIAWTRLLTGSTHVTRSGLFIAVGAGGIIAGAILGMHKHLWRKRR